MKKRLHILPVLISLVCFCSCGGGSTNSYAQEKEERAAEEARQKEEEQRFIDSFTFKVAQSQQTIGQRSGEVLPKIKSTPTGQLTSATGWLLTDAGGWVSRKNRIVADVINRYPELADFEKYGLGKDNFISYKLHEMEYNGNQYVILIQTKNYGWESDSGKWYTDREAKYWVMNPSELDQLASLQDKEATDITFKVLVKGELRFDIGLNDIAKNIIIEAKRREESRVRPEYDILHLILYPDKAANKVLFLFEKSHYYKSFNDRVSYSGSHESVNELLKNYYETTYTNFSKLFKLP